MVCGNIIRKEYYLVVWKHVCNSLEQRGLGISNLNNTNKALLCKWLWRYHDLNEKGLWKQFLISKYNNRRSLVNASIF
jgi:hypothetical protein